MMENLPQPSLVNHALSYHSIRPRNYIPFLESSIVKRFNFPRTNYTRKDVTVTPGPIEGTILSTYRIMQVITGINFEITEAEFLRMSRTIILMRVQDVYACSKGLYSSNFLPLTRSRGTFLLPAPIADLCYQIGYYYSPILGIRFEPVPPLKANVNSPDWWTVDNRIVEAYLRLCCRMSRSYTMKEYPSFKECEATGLLLTNSQVVNNCVTVKSFTNEANMTDGLIRAVHENGFIDNAPYPSDNCHFNVISDKNFTELVNAYVASYVKPYI
ncbi:hypothetical protein ABEB36_007668 [Hypothenemus hampei]|uniref:Uncharacterized protein n=1 Tax=Hypothenemus hampei TaxID=57062 RepID=A0ABD1EV00_HYPHA